MNEPSIVICTRLADLSVAVADTVSANCADCNNIVGIAPSTVTFVAQQIAEGKEIIYVCTVCVVNRKEVMEDNDPPKVIPGQLNELKEILGDGSEDYNRILEFLNMPIRETVVSELEGE